MKSWLDCYADAMGTIYDDGTLMADDVPVRHIVMRGRYSLVAYVGLPPDHPAAGHPYDLVPLEVHAGLTYAGLGDDAPQPAGWWWYGWDYAHAFDRTWMHLEMRDLGMPTYRDRELLEQRERQWEIPEVVAEAQRAAEQMAELIRQRWLPAPEAIAEEEEGERRRREMFANPDATLASLEAATRKARRMKELEG